MKKTILGVMLLLCCGIAVNAAKIAVIADKGLENYADLLTAELSKQKDLNVIERVEINKILKEQEISNAKLTANYLEFGKLLNADGLIIIMKYVIQKKEFLVSRLVAVNQGAVLSSFSNPCPPEKIEGWPADVSAKFAPYLNKLNVAQDKAVPISIMNIRAPIDTPEMRLLEKEFTLTLAFRLIQEKDLFVLERWKMDKLAWEKDIDTDSSNPFWTGSYLLDGSIELTDKENVKVKVRLRKFSGSESTIEATGKKDKLSEITEKLTGELLKQIGKNQDRIPWDSAKEAEQYLSEARWAFSAGLYSAARSGADAAWVLGNHSPNLCFLRIKSYCGEPLDQCGHIINISGRKASNSRFDYRLLIDDMQNALILYDDFIKGNPQDATIWDRSRFENDWASLGFFVLRMSSRVLEGIRGDGKPINDALSRKMADLRHSIVKTYNLSTSKGKGKQAYNYLNLAALHYGGYWGDTPEESISIYKKALDRKLPDARSLRHDLISRDVDPKYGLPWLVSWNNQKDSELDRLWFSFISSLIDSDNSDDKADGLMLAFLSPRFPIQEKELITMSMDLLQNNQKMLVENNQSRTIDVLMTYLRRMKQGRVSSANDFSFAMIVYMLENCKNNPSLEMLRDTFTFGGEYSKEQLLKIQNALVKLKNDLSVKNDVNSKCIKDVNTFENIISLSLAKHQKGNSGRSNGFLISDYIPLPEAVCPSKEFKSLCLMEIHRHDKELWLRMAGSYGYDNKALLMLNEAGREFKTISLPKMIDNVPLRSVNCFDVANDTLFLMGGEGTVFKTKLDSNQWSVAGRIEVPDGIDECQMMSYKDKLLISFSYKFSKPTNSSGIVLFDTKTGNNKIIASNRRRPAQSLLDDCKVYGARAFACTPDGRLYISAGKGLFSYEISSEKWSNIMTFEEDFSPYIQRYENGILTCTSWGNLFVIPDGLNQVDSLLLTDKKYGGKVWTPLWLAEYGRWKSADGFISGSIMYRYVYDGNDLYVVCKTYPEESVKPGDPYYLKVFRKGEAKSSIVPLAFDGADSSKFYTDRGPVMVQMMECGESLIFVVGGCDRVWRLPKTEVNKYLDKNGNK